jgi:hypothetical protein
MKKLLLIIGVVALSMIAAPATVTARNPKSVTIGQVTKPTTNACTAQQYRVQTGVAFGMSYTVPPGSWKIHSWSTYAFDGQMALMIFRPTATSGIYTVVGLSEIETLAPVAAGWRLKTFRGGDLHVEGGDLLGFYTPTSLRGCDAYTAMAGDTTQYLLRTAPVVGADTPMMSDPILGNPPGYHLEISATLFPEDE